ncbi:MAG: MarR family transcriptional regulator [Caulobacteraceae bacterium]|nr:MarR family transcriptional regulator [Caulobacteraceae bacterium]
MTQADFEALARFRQAVRQYLAFAEKGAKAAGLTSQQHQALLAIKAQSYSGTITIGDLANRLLLKSHSAAGLVDRLAANDLVTRETASIDRRVVHLRLTSKGEHVLALLSERNLQELRIISPALETSLNRFEALRED